MAQLSVAITRLLVLVLVLALPSSVRAQGAMSEGYITTADSIRLFYRVVGTRGDTIVAIHGGPGVDLESLYGDFARLADRHVVIFYDQRGTGRSSLPDTSRLTAERQVADLDAVRVHFGLERMTLMAHSYGPLLAASYALAHPDRVRRMVFFGPVPPRRGNFWDRFRATSNARIDSATALKMADARRRLMDKTADARAACRDYWAAAIRPRIFEPDRNAQLVKADLCASNPEGIRYGLTVTGGAVWSSYGDWDLRERLRTLDIPTLIVHGEEDAIPMDLVEEWARSMPHATLIRVPRAAHWVYAERPDFVWPAVESFLAR